MDPFNSQFILKEKRWPWVDYDKGISIILVGYAHCYFVLNGYGPHITSYPFFNYLDAFLYGFRMPLFFIISGFLVTRSLNKKGLGKYIGDRVNNILYPLFIWGFIDISFKIVNAKLHPGTFHEDASPIYYLDLIINPRIVEPFWYLNALFGIGVIYTFFKAKLKLTTITQVILGLVFFCISSYIHLNSINAGALTDILGYYFFFSLGDLLSKVTLDEKTMRQIASWKIFLPLLLIFLITQFFCARIELNETIDGISYVEHRMPVLYIVQVLIGCALSISFSFMLQKLKLFTFLRVVGFHSLYIYCMQIIVMTMMRVLLFNVMKLTFVPVLFPLIWASGVVLPVFFYNFCLRYKLWWLFTFKKPQRETEYLQNTNIFSLGAAGKG